MTCTTHHRACECREREYERLRERVEKLEAAVRDLECDRFMQERSCRTLLVHRADWCCVCRALAALEETR